MLSLHEKNLRTLKNCHDRWLEPPDDEDEELTEESFLQERDIYLEFESKEE